MIISSEAGPPSFYPLTLTQLSTLGERHNQAPSKFLKNIPAVDDADGVSVPTNRFYFDGLACHVALEGWSSDKVEDAGAFVVGNDPDVLIVQTVTWEESSQKIFLSEAIEDSFRHISRY
ncbi:hypothetical protein [uncultured Enterovirga sp.]|uniref:hypothetical protein n=1 Tax=uncultured Enterovirga sp. TaxID=2026352 RepID=UPI0035CA90E6